MRKLKITAALLSIAVMTTTWAADTPRAAGERRAAIQELKQSLRSKDEAKLGVYLHTLASPDTSTSTQSTMQSSSRSMARAPSGSLLNKLKLRGAQDGYVGVSAFANGNPEALRTELIAKGMLDAHVHETSVSGRLPIAALKDAAASPSLRFMRMTMAKTNVKSGAIVSQGDRSQHTDVVRAKYGIDGNNVRVGVLSDSYDCAPGPFAEGAPFTRAAQDIARGDLPRDVLVLKDISKAPSDDCTDEGRAMMQLIHDVAPGSPLAFYTAFESEEDFASGIVALADAGSKVIVDDVIYYAEPMFQDGIIARAVDTVKSRGVAYFSAAGNQARQSYESLFRNSGREGLSGVRHNFGTRKSVDDLQSMTADPESITLLSLQWDQPFYSVTGGAGSANDVDAYFVDRNGEPIEICTDDPEQVVCQIPGIDSNVGNDAIEIPILVNLSEDPLEVQLAIELYEGPAPGFVKYVWYDLANGIININEHDTQSGTLYGHANAAGAEAIGAAAWYNTEEWGSPMHAECVPACAEVFSSAGSVPILFNKLGKRLLLPEYRVKPGVTGPDGGNTSFFYFDLASAIPGTTEPDGVPNFFGTSAAAPHVAAIGALMLDKRNRDIAAGKHFIDGALLKPDEMYWALRFSAEDLKLRAGRLIGPFDIENAKGPDFDTGFGFVNAERAIKLISGF